MKFPKHKANLYVVERYNKVNNSSTFIGGFIDETSADEFRDACAQEWLDKMNGDTSVTFGVVLSTFYAA